MTSSLSCTHVPPHFIIESRSDDRASFSCYNLMTVIVVPPQFVIEPRSQTVSQGQTVTLDCVSDGEPEPEISWRKGRTSLPSPTLSPRFTVLHNNSLRSVSLVSCSARSNHSNSRNYDNIFTTKVSRMSSLNCFE